MVEWLFFFVVVFTDGKWKLSHPHITVSECDAQRHMAQAEGHTVSECFGKKGAIL